MTPRENLLRVLRHEEPEWIPIVAHVDPYNQPSQVGMDAALREKLKKVEWGDESLLAISRALELDIADYVWPPPLRCQRRTVTIEEKTDGSDHITVWHTPAGDLREVTQLVRADGTSHKVEHMVKSPADLPALAALFADEVWEYEPEQVRRCTARRSLIGDDGILMFALPGTPLGMMYRAYCTVETLAYLWADAEADLHDLFAIMERSYLRQYQLLAELPETDVLIGMDDTSTTVLSPAMFAACNLALTDARAAVAHTAGKFYFHHSCGLIKDLLPLYRQTRMDCVHAFSVPPIGNVTIAEGRQQLGNRIGIFTPAPTMAEMKWDPPAIRHSLQAMFTEAGPRDNFFMCICAYPHRTMEQTKFHVECCREFAAR